MKSLRVWTNLCIYWPLFVFVKSTVREPAKKIMYKGISAAYSIIVCSYWQLAFFGYWAFGSQVQPYILASLTTRWAIVMANLFAVIQISGCFQVGFFTTVSFTFIFFIVLNCLLYILLPFHMICGLNILFPFQNIFHFSKWIEH